FGLIDPEVGLFGITDQNGLDVRVSMLLCAAWTLAFSIPVLRVIRDHPCAARGGGASARGLVAHLLLPVKKLAASYRRLWGTIIELWHLDRTTVYFLGASAIFRDGLRSEERRVGKEGRVRRATGA